MSSMSRYIQLKSFFHGLSDVEHNEASDGERTGVRVSETPSCVSFQFHPSSLDRLNLVDPEAGGCRPLMRTRSETVTLISQ